MFTEGFREPQERSKEQREPQNPCKTLSQLKLSGHQDTEQQQEALNEEEYWQGPARPESCRPVPTVDWDSGDALGPVPDGCQRSEIGPPAVLASSCPCLLLSLPPAGPGI